MRCAAAETLIFHAMALHYYFEWNRVVFTLANALQSMLGEIYVLEISQVMQDRFSGTIGLATPSAASQSFKSYFDRLRKPDD
jgi:hypothetical protein